MIGIWYSIVSFLLLGFFVLEGFDIGAGMLQCVVARNEEERRSVINAIGPLWAWNEVWLIAFGGTLLMAFPTALALTFSGYYLALMALVWGLILRGIAMEFSGLLADPLWRTAWHFCFVASNILLAVLMGAALGNVIRGVPLGEDGKFSLAFFTNFSPYGRVGILDWYTISIAILTVAIFALHGANGLVMRTAGSVRDRSVLISRRLSKVAITLLAVVIVQTLIIRPDLCAAIVRRPLGWLGGIAVIAGAAALIRASRHGDMRLAFMASRILIAGLIVTSAVGVFPLMLRSTLRPEYSLSAYQLAADWNGLQLAMGWWWVAFAFAVFYSLIVYRFFYRGAVTTPAAG